MPMMPSDGASVIEYRVSPPVTNDVLNELFAACQPDHRWCDFAPQLSRSLAYVCAYADGQLVGFVNLAWDGGIHAFVLDPTVRPNLRRQGIGRQLVSRAVAVARERAVEWVHVDYEPHLHAFYQSCGFRPTTAGLIHLAPDDHRVSP